MSLDLHDIPDGMNQEEFERYINFKKKIQEKNLKEVEITWTDGRSEVRYCNPKQIQQMQDNEYIRSTVIRGER